ncbi:MAG: hypothetical protein QGF00_16880 [Planctomycetota bacterium]|jgi:TolA-binding protein|nr:hypothetical protein [Planctomycetota bacterium]MDP7251284.1 hypothetical protein [Planctomycetota bacterium]
MKFFTTTARLMPAFAALSFFFVAAPSVADNHEQIQRWKPKYKPYTRNSTQRERRTGQVSDEYTETENKWVEPVKPQAQTKPRGFLKSKTADDQKKSKGFMKKIWPFKKNPEVKGIGKPLPAAAAVPAAPIAAAPVPEGQAVREGKERRGFLGALKKIMPGKSKKGLDESRKARKVRKTEKGMAKAEAELAEENAKNQELKAKEREMSVKEIEKRLETPVEPKPLPKETPASYVKGKDYFDKGDYAKAIQHFGDFIASDELDRNPLVAPARYFIAKSFENLEQTDVALSLYRQIQDEHDDSQFWSGLAGFELASLRGEGASEPEDWVTDPAEKAEKPKPEPEIEKPDEETTTVPDADDAPPELPEDVVNTTIPDEGEKPAVAPGGAPSEAPSEAPSFAPGGAPGN